jgi:polyvinyl alcohol dehydrogenase (cytochrome)
MREEDWMKSIWTKVALACALTTTAIGCGEQEPTKAADVAFEGAIAFEKESPEHYRASWLSWSSDTSNTRSQPKENTISTHNVSKLAVNWKTDLGGEISATPAVEGNAVYVSDWSGIVSRLDRTTGAVVWQTSIAAVTGVPGNSVRATPTIAGDLIVIGDQGGKVGAGARVVALNKQTGALVWKTVADTHPAAVITQSATVFDGKVLVGVSSVEEFFAVAVQGYECCSFRGSMLMLDLATGVVVWQTPMIDDAAYAKGYRGNAIWGSQPSVDAARHTVYVATGNNYDIPPEVGACVKDVLASTPNDEAAVRACLAGDNNYFDALVALDLTDGHVKWAKPVMPFDAFTISCVFNLQADNCPSPSGPDHDFGQAPMMFQVGNGKKKRDLIGAGQKSGMFWALNPDNGDLVWSTKVGPGGHLGGAMWGSATDGERLYVTISNSQYQPWTLQGKGPFAGQVVTKGFWSALNPETGAILWQTPDPNDVTPAASKPSGGVMAPVTVANGVLYGASLAPAPDARTMFAFDAASGAILWSFAAGASVNCGPAIADGVLYWGSGYVGGGLNLGTPGKTLFTFSLPQH